MVCVLPRCLSHFASRSDTSESARPLTTGSFLDTVIPRFILSSTLHSLDTLRPRDSRLLAFASSGVHFPQILTPPLICQASAKQAAKPLFMRVSADSAIPPTRRSYSH